MFLLFGAFIAGMLTVLAPCVLPLLPIIIGGSITGNTADRRRPLIITASLAVSLLVFTLLLKATALFINIPPQSITLISGGIIIILGILTLFPLAYATFMARIGFEQKAQGLLGSGATNKNKVLGPIIIGAALGPVFSSCSPVYAYILATVLPVNFGEALAYIIAYVLGLSVILLLVGYLGQRFIKRIKFASDPRGWFQRVIAIIFIIVGLMIITGLDKKFQTYVSTNTPFDFDSISSSFLPESKNAIDDTKLFNVTPYDAPEFTGLESWINSQPVELSQLKGKVVLVDFWTYSCINCIRNNPYIERWHQAYKDDGLVVIGIHAPEFAFEKVKANVEKGVRDQKLTYPVALDNDFSTWNAFDNRSWPSSYLIDAEGQVRRIHEGEGQYEESEQAIRELLTKSGAKLGNKTTSGKEAVPVSANQTPETYLGTQRASNFDSTPALGAAATSTFTAPATLPKNHWALSGTWAVSGEKITAKSNAVLTFHISAKNVYVVGGSSDGSSVTVKIPGRADALVKFGPSQLYPIANFDALTDTTIQMVVPAGVELNVFTFGS